VCRSVGTVPGILGLVWLRFRPHRGSKAKIAGRILKSCRGPFSAASPMGRFAAHRLDQGFAASRGRPDPPKVDGFRSAPRPLRGVILKTDLGCPRDRFLIGFGLDVAVMDRKDTRPGFSK
jgi:hypothetical protein